MLTFSLGDTKAIDKVDEKGKSKELVIDVTANLYWWEFSYPNEKIVTSQELVVPTDKKFTSDYIQLMLNTHSGYQQLEEIGYKRRRY